MHEGYKIGNLEALAMSTQPMLEVTEQTHHRLSSSMGVESLRIRQAAPSLKSLLRDE